MSQATSANSVIKTFKAGGTIHAGHIVKISAQDTVVEATANKQIGVYVGEQDAAAGDHIPVCIAGPCRVWADATAAITAQVAVASDDSGHCIVDDTDKHQILGFALDLLGSGTGYVEILVQNGFFAK